MSDRKSFSPENAQELISQLDAVRRQSESIRGRIEDGLRRRPFWPDRRDAGRSDPSQNASEGDAVT